MLELFHLSLFGSAIAGILVFLFLIFMFFVADVQQNGFIATFSLIVVGVFFYLWGKDSFLFFISFFSLKSIWIYLGLGLIHAITRIYFYGRQEAKRINEERLASVTHIRSIDRDISEDVFRWWFLWPISLTVWIIQDMIIEIYDWVYSKLSGFFNFIMDLGFKSVTPVPDPKKKKDE